MKKFATSLVLLALSSSAWACSAGNTLVKQYGVSFSGFERPIPRAQAAPPLDDLIAVVLPDNSRVSDGFEHTAYIDPATKRAWILRTGGFIGVTEWYGPVDASAERLAGCSTRRQQRLTSPRDVPSISVPSL
jgi:hypothetical protein